MATLTQTKPGTEAVRPINYSRELTYVLRRIGTVLLVTGVGLVVMLVFLMPLGYMIATAFKHDSQLSAQKAPLWPAENTTYNYQGKDLPLYNVPTADGTKQWALVQGHREDSDFIDPNN